MMSLLTERRYRKALAAGAAMAGLVAFGATPSFAEERLRCRAHYDVGGGGSTLAQNLTCASDSYKFNVVSNVREEGGQISGTWSETSRGADGRITGRITPTQISAQVNGVGFSARIGIAARGGRQSVTISPTGTDITNVSVTMSKRCWRLDIGV